MLFDLFKKQDAINVPEITDEIEGRIYPALKPLGFRRYGRTLHRFVSGDLSQVIHFQSGMPLKGMGGLLCVNLGIRIPECVEQSFHPNPEKKKYYPEYDCTLRSRLGTVSGKEETWYDLRRGAEKIAEDVLDQMYELLSEFGVVSISDYLDMLGVDHDYTYDKYGWTNLRNVEIGIDRHSGEYYLRLPRPKLID